MDSRNTDPGSRSRRGAGDVSFGARPPLSVDMAAVRKPRRSHRIYARPIRRRDSATPCSGSVRQVSVGAGVCGRLHGLLSVAGPRIGIALYRAKSRPDRRASRREPRPANRTGPLLPTHERPPVMSPPPPARFRSPVFDILQSRLGGIPPRTRSRARCGSPGVVFRGSPLRFAYRSRIGAGSFHVKRQRRTAHGAAAATSPASASRPGSPLRGAVGPSFTPQALRPTRPQLRFRRPVSLRVAPRGEPLAGSKRCPRPVTARRRESRSGHRGDATPEWADPIVASAPYGAPSISARVPLTGVLSAVAVRQSPVRGSGSPVCCRAPRRQVAAPRGTAHPCGPNWMVRRCAIVVCRRGECVAREAGSRGAAGGRDARLEHQGMSGAQAFFARRPLIFGLGARPE